MILQDHNAKDFLDAAGPLLYRDEAANTLLLGLAEDLAKRPSVLSTDAPLYLRVVEDGVTVAAVLRTPPVNIVMTQATPKQIEDLAGYIHTFFPAIPGVVAPSKVAEAFAAEWCLLSGQKPRLGMNNLIYASAAIEVPDGPHGQFRSFRPEEFDLLLRWTAEFVRESIPSDLRSEAAWPAIVERNIRNGTSFMWLADDEPVAMMALSRPTKNTITINSVYTPKHQRRRGYASMLVARISEKMLLSKKLCVLYADTENPTSNKIYQKIGYREVADSKLIHFD